MRVYLAGPMRGYDEFNFPAFIQAAAELREAGFEVISPAEHDIESGFDPATHTEFDIDMQAVVCWDLEQILHHAEGIVLLPGWEKSRGARAEVHVAIFKNIPVLVYLGNGHIGSVTHRQAERRAARAVL